jgi:hypothetical protein
MGGTLLTNGQRKGAVTETEPTDGTILRLWLHLLGWKIETAKEGDYLVGVGTHIHGDGRVVRVGGCASSEGELVFQLFEQAMRKVSCSHQEIDARLVAA